MGQQLDAGRRGDARSARWPRRSIGCRLGRSAIGIEADRVVLDDGEELPASRVVVAAGVRAETSLARAAGLPVARGIVVDDTLRAGAPGVWAVGECAEHRGVVYGLWAPLAEQARVAGARVAGDPAAFHGAVPADDAEGLRRRRLRGRRLRRRRRPTATTSRRAQRHAARDLPPARARRRAAHRRGARRRRRRGARTLSELLRSGDPVPESMLGAGPAQPDAAQLAADPAATLCTCNAVSVGDVQAAIRRGGLRTVAQVGARTRATTGCGGCTADVQSLLAAAAVSAATRKGRVVSPAPPSARHDLGRPAPRNHTDHPDETGQRRCRPHDRRRRPGQVGDGRGRAKGPALSGSGSASTAATSSLALISVARVAGSPSRAADRGPEVVAAPRCEGRAPRCRCSRRSRARNVEPRVLTDGDVLRRDAAADAVVDRLSHGSRCLEAAASCSRPACCGRASGRSCAAHHRDALGLDCPAGTMIPWLMIVERRSAISDASMSCSSSTSTTVSRSLGSSTLTYISLSSSWSSRSDRACGASHHRGRASH